MTAYVTLRRSLELCLLKPYDWEAVKGLLTQLDNDYRLEVRLHFMELFTKAGFMKACRRQFLKTLDELRIAYGARLSYLQGQYHEDMGLYLRYRKVYYEAKDSFFADLDKLEEKAES